MTRAHDVFFSYRRSDLARAKPLLDAMALAGLRVWRDEAAISDGASISREIREGLAACKGLLAFYSSAYPLSTACQQELALAYVAAERAGEPPYQRVLIINAENSFDHIPLLLRDHLAFHWTDKQPSFGEVARRISRHVNGLNGTLAAALHPLPQFHGIAAVQASHFIGRHTELWDLHREADRKSDRRHQQRSRPVPYPSPRTWRKWQNPFGQRIRHSLWRSLSRRRFLGQRLRQR